MRHDQPQQSGRSNRDFEQRDQRYRGRYEQGGGYADDQQNFGREYRGFDDEFEEGAHTEFDRRRGEGRDSARFDEHEWANPQQFEPEGSRRQRESAGNRFGNDAERRMQFGRDSERGSRFGAARFGSDDIFGQERGQNYSGAGRSQHGSPAEGWGGYRGRSESRSDYSSYQGEPGRMGSRFGQQGQADRGGLYGSEGAFGAGAPWSGGGAYGSAAQQGSSPWRSASEQSFRGKGPKGFTRSDERLKEVICESLTDDHDIDASEVSIDVKQGKVTLSGTVGERRQKYLIDERVEEMGGVKEVDNQLRVRKHDESDAGAQTGSQHGQSGQQRPDSNRSNEQTSRM